MVFAYVRVSSPDQNPDMQIDLFNKEGYDRLYIEKRSGVKRLFELERCINDLREGDTLLIYDLDRLGRTALNILETVRILHKEKKVRIHSLNDSVDTTSFGGQLVVHILSLMAEKERDKIVTRCQDGRRSAKQRGVKFGRPQGSGDKETAKACVLLYQSGESIKTIQKTLKISRDTIYRNLQAANVEPNRKSKKEQPQE